MLLLALLLSSLVGFSTEAATRGQQVVASVLLAEASVDGVDGMTAVAEVIRNRADKSNVSMLAVVQKPYAFSSLNSVDVDELCRKMQQRKDYPIALSIARIAYNEPGKLPGLTKGATHFHTISTKPYWTKGVEPVATVGRHHFYKL